jgi:heme A synthase
MKTNITKTQYFVHSYPSLIGGIFAAGAAIALLVRDGIQNGITLEHALMPVLVGLTVLFGHETWRALKEGKLISCALMAMLAVFGSGIIITETMGRRAENRDAKVAQATKTVEQYAVIAADYQRAAALVAQSEQWTAAECATGRGKKCEGQTFTLNQRKAHAEKLKAQLEKATAPAPVDSKADRVAAVAALFGFKGEQAKAAFQTFDPFTLALFLELGAVAGFGFSVRTRKVSVPAETTKALSFENEKGDRSDQEIEDIKKALSGLGHAVTNDQLASILGCSKSEASKRWRRCAEAGVLEAQRAGRYVHLRLVA